MILGVERGFKLCERVSIIEDTDIALAEIARPCHRGARGLREGLLDAEAGQLAAERDRAQRRGA